MTELEAGAETLGKPRFMKQARRISSFGRDLELN